MRAGVGGLSSRRCAAGSTLSSSPRSIELWPSCSVILALAPITVFELSFARSRREPAGEGVEGRGS